MAQDRTAAALDASPPRRAAQVVFIACAKEKDLCDVSQKKRIKEREREEEDILCQSNSKIAYRYSQRERERGRERE